MSTVKILVTEPDDLKAPAGCYRIIAQDATGQQRIVADFYEEAFACFAADRLTCEFTDDLFMLYDDQGTEIEL